MFVYGLKRRLIRDILKKYGFESIGKRGRAKENLMIKRKEA